MNQENSTSRRLRIAPDFKLFDSEMEVLHMFLAIHIEDYYCELEIEDAALLEKPGLKVHHGSFDVTFFFDAIDGQFRIMMPEIKRLLYRKLHRRESNDIYNYIADLKSIYKSIQYQLASSNQTKKKISASYYYLFGVIELKLIKPLLEIKIKYIIELIEYLYGIMPEEVLKTGPLRKQRPSIAKWSDAFSRSTDYLNIIELLTKEGYMREGTFMYEDTRKGNKGFIVAIIKHLWSLKYYKPELGRIKDDEIRMICMELGVVVSPSKVKQAKPGDYNLSFIPQKFDN